MGDASPRRARETATTLALMVLPVGLAVLAGVDAGASGPPVGAVGAAVVAAGAVVVAAARLRRARRAFAVPLAAVCIQFLVWNLLPVIALLGGQQG